MKIDSSTWDQPELIPLRRRRGRPDLGDGKLIFKSVGLRRDQWEWLEKWMPNGSPTSQIQELFLRALKFWPSGPARFR